MRRIAFVTPHRCNKIVRTIKYSCQFCSTSIARLRRRHVRYSVMFHGGYYPNKSRNRSAMPCDCTKEAPVRLWVSAQAWDVSTLEATSAILQSPSPRDAPARWSALLDACPQTQHARDWRVDAANSANLTTIRVGHDGALKLTAGTKLHQDLPPKGSDDLLHQRQPESAIDTGCVSRLIAGWLKRWVVGNQLRFLVSFRGTCICRALAGDLRDRVQM